MHRRKGFTLIELLVVIAIIALLMAILMPALQRVKKQAQEVKCRAYLKQWGLIFALYTEDNDNKFMSTGTGLWVNPLRPYYKNGGEAMRTCPTATKTAEEGASPVFAAWDLVTKPYEEDVYRGSYGINNWLYNMPAGQMLWNNPTDNNWRTTAIKQASSVPMFLECWRWGGHPYDTEDTSGLASKNSQPPITEEYLGQDGFTRFCLNRHNGTVNCAFVDFSARSVGLKELWRLKWHRKFNVGAAAPNWPEWMAGLKDY